MMKKTFLSLLVLASVSFGVVLGEGCFHDAISVVDKPGMVTRGANIRNIACMDGSSVVATLKAGTKVRIIGQTAWTKIVMPGGKIGWIGNSFIQESDSWTSVPEMPSSITPDYCDTTNSTRCPNPCAPGEMPTFYTSDGSSDSSYGESSYSDELAPNPVLDSILDEFYEKLDAKYQDNNEKRITVVKGVISSLNMLKNRNPKLKDAINYLVVKLQENL